MRQALADKQAREEAERQRAAAAAKARLAEQKLFERAIGAVQPLNHAPRVELQVTRPSPTAFQQALDDQAALRESLSDEFDVSTLLDVDDQMSFRRPGIGHDVTRKLRRGDWTIQGQVDLHGLRSDEARDALGQFIRDAMRMGWRCVRVVHGKGLGSPGKTCAEIQNPKMAGAKKRGLGFRASQAGGRRCRRAGGAAQGSGLTP